MQDKDHHRVIFRLYPQTLLIVSWLFVLLSLAPLVKIPALDSDWRHGFYHPLQGWDHLLTMIAVGIWAAPLSMMFTAVFSADRACVFWVRAR